MSTKTRAEYVILIAFPLQQWLHEHASMLHYATLPLLLPFCRSACRMVIKELRGEVGYSIRKAQDRGLAFVIPATNHRIS
jgi:hypothetical protein